MRSSAIQNSATADAKTKTELHARLLHLIQATRLTDTASRSSRLYSRSTKGGKAVRLAGVPGPGGHVLPIGMNLSPVS